MRNNNYSVYGEYFNGAKISDHGLENNRVDYGTLAKNIDCVLCNGIFDAVPIDEWEQTSGFLDNTEKIEELQERIDELEELEEEDNDKLIEELQERIEELEDEQNYYPEVFQWFITDNNGADILSLNNEIIFYNEQLDLYLWGVTHFGTAWSYVLTDIPCNTGTF